jgi:hypothetical protein
MSGSLVYLREACVRQSLRTSKYGRLKENLVMRSSIVAVVFAISTLFAAAPAMAQNETYPMPAATFQQLIASREATAREKMEKHAAHLSPADATAYRSKFDAAVARVDAQVAKATADGTVTKDEAIVIAQVARDLDMHK